MGSVSSTLGLEPLVDKFRAFNFNVVECDGHNHHDLNKAFNSSHHSKPTIILCPTTKGKGVDFMENSVLWHCSHKVLSFRQQRIFELISDTRDTFVNALLHAALHDPRILLITADLGFKVFDEFIEKCPNQFLNVGICEQAMIGIACGFALEGRKVFCYSIGNFPTLRCLEQIRNDACYHNLDITIVSVGVGFSYGQLGMSHFATEDLSIISSLLISLYILLHRIKKWTSVSLYS